MEVIDEDDVSIEALLQLFRRAFLKAKIDDDGDVYITDGLDFPIWVAVDVEQRLIRFFTFMQRDEGRPFTEAAANHANATVVLPTFHVRCDHKDRLCWPLTSIRSSSADAKSSAEVVTADHGDPSE